MEHKQVVRELGTIKSGLLKLNHLQGCNPPLQFFTNEIKAIEELEQESESRAAQEQIYWLAATLSNYDKSWSAYKGKITAVKERAIELCLAMGGIRCSWMAPSPQWDLDEVRRPRTFKVFALRYTEGCGEQYSIPMLNLDHVPSIEELGHHINRHLQGTTALVHWCERISHEEGDYIHPNNRCIWDGCELHTY